ncbi:MAG: hypothetical protein R3E44_09095 [Paracoccaceae bacterium]
MTYRLTMGAVFTTFPELADAQSEALDHARELTRACGFPVTVTVHRMGQPARDRLGRDVTAATWVGSAVGRIEHSNAFATWLPAPSRVRAASKEAAA